MKLQTLCFPKISKFAFQLFLPILCLSILLGCGGNKPDPLDDLAKPVKQGPPPFGQGISGYNEPLEWKNNIGLRAVSQGNVILISVKNETDEPVFVEPQAFRLIKPEGLYEFQEGREDLSGFVPRNVAPGEGDLFSIGLPLRAGDPAGLALVFNYPPADTIVRAFIEETSETVIRTELAPVEPVN